MKAQKLVTVHSIQFYVLGKAEVVTTQQYLVVGPFHFHDAGELEAFITKMKEAFTLASGTTADKIIHYIF